jgi:predicted house-cleaning NTP pyrophosphatase (Maf/HAM1 superfamily)
MPQDFSVHMSTQARASTALVALPYKYVAMHSAQRSVFLKNGGEQGLGGLLIRKIEGDYHNVVGFPAASFFRFLDLLVEEDDDFLEV